jgi:hypothetical protein
MESIQYANVKSSGRSTASKSDRSFHRNISPLCYRADGKKYPRRIGNGFSLQ